MMRRLSLVVPMDTFLPPGKSFHHSNTSGSDDDSASCRLFCLDRMTDVLQAMCFRASRLQTPGLIYMVSGVYSLENCYLRLAFNDAVSLAVATRGDLLNINLVTESCNNLDSEGTHTKCHCFIMECRGLCRVLCVSHMLKIELGKH